LLRSGLPAYSFALLSHIPQHVKGEVDKTFKQAIQQVSQVAFSLPDPAAPIALGRVWCLFELGNAIAEKVEV